MKLALEAGRLGFEAGRIAEKKYAEAEKAARSAVRTLENTDRPSLLAEALKRHGISLARLGSYGSALTAFRRAIDLCQEIDSLNRAADISLTLYQELGEQLAIKGAKCTSGKPFDEEVFSLESELIKHALEDAQGRVTSAARILGMSYQRLTHKLETEHRDLLRDRTPVQRRARKLIFLKD